MRPEGAWFDALLEDSIEPLSLVVLVVRPISRGTVERGLTVRSANRTPTTKLPVNQYELDIIL